MATKAGVFVLASFVAGCFPACGGKTTATGATTPATDTAGTGGGGGAAGGMASSGSAGTAGIAGAPGGGSSIAPLPGQPPPPPVNGVDASALPRSVFAVRTWYLGDVDWNGNATPEACWDYAWNLDGKTFPKPDSQKHCNALNDKNPTTPGSDQDGPLGVDNRLGCALGALPMFSSTASGFTASGGASVLFTIDHLGPDSDYTGTPGSIASAVGSVDASGKPVAPTDASWTDGSYVWHPLVGDFLVAPCGGKPIAYSASSPLPGGYVSGGTWVAGDFGPFTFVIPIGPQAFGPKATPMAWLPLRVQHGWVTASLSDDRRRLVKGTLGGIVSISDVDTAVKFAFGCAGICPSVGWQFADMMLDGTQDHTKDCDGISVSFGFEAELVTEGDGVAVPTVEGAPCFG